MKTARLKNIFLGIIAINLTLITLIQLEIFPPKAYASETSQPINTNYGLVPLNEDGVMQVEVVGLAEVVLYGWKKSAMSDDIYGFVHNPLPVDY